MGYAQGGAAYRIRRNGAYRRLHAHEHTQTDSTGFTGILTAGTAGFVTTHFSVRVTATNASGSDTKTRTRYINVTH